ncbi:hypothetical protein [Alcaligenes endophyticus]|uniref:Uncharacterized protein n=1 Tax=Alcaligenes endophyticus TaxID=1929088 RepID=A0ABT8EJY9_9BURK|nr:hypothetical protein [Alcaligenes endophyticus]MCX5591924.1 hypothetical protein [Alcaligenes endophyticus]MDN4121613.1 hypothetical protein [Alcaligenes endophyticus]
MQSESYLDGSTKSDPALLAAALGDIARARGMTQLAHDTERAISRKPFWKAYAKLRYTIKIIHAQGFKLKVEPTTPRRAARWQQR